MKFRIYYIIILAILIHGCSAVKNVPEDEYLLKKVIIKGKPSDLSSTKLTPFVKQKENLKILGTLKFQLGLYNLAGKDTSKNFNKWLRRIGEPPVLYDDYLATQSTELLTTYLENKGYFHASVSDTLIYVSKKKVKVRYDINEGDRFLLKNVGFRAEDPVLGEIVLEDQEESLLKEGRPFDVNMHDKERERITSNLRNKGFYSFSKEFVYFKADSSIGNFQVNDSIIIKNAKKNISRYKDTTFVHSKYRIKDVYYRMGYDTHRALTEKEDYFNQFDTLIINDSHFLYLDEIEVNPEVLHSSSHIQPGQLYQEELVDRTQALLSNLKLYRYVNIRFVETEAPNSDQSNDGEKWLDCQIQLVPAKYQSYSVDVEGTNSSGNLGAGGNFKYGHKNIFRGAEEFAFRFGGSWQSQYDRDKDLFSTVELGTEATIVFPKFWMPFKVERFRQRYNPKTSLSVAYNYQRRPDYTRTIANAKISYLWRSNSKVSHVFTPLGVNFVTIPKVDSTFWSEIKDTYLRYSYENHLISSTSYSFVYNEQELNKRKNFWYFNWNIEEAGNFLNLYAKAIGKEVEVENEDGSSVKYKEVFGVRYAQYIQSDIDVRYHHYLNQINSFAYRFYLGVGYPYGNLDVLPFEKRYISGGANSIRAWPVRGLGPGSFYDAEASYYNQTGDIKLEWNAEYRFKLFWLLEGALFLDVGNIYTIREDISPDKSALFRFKNFSDKLAVGTGVGVRFDVNYFIFRLDTGMKLRDPIDYPANDNGKRPNKWLIGSRPYTWNDFAFNFAIGYPF